jgi:hypothetical protein
MVLRMDPFRRQLSTGERNRLVIEAFTIAGQRLEKCAVPSGNAGSAPKPQTNVSDEWSTMKPQITENRLLRNPDLWERAMDLVFRIERQTSTTCGTPAGADLVLLLMSKLHEGNAI